ncbi:MAG: RNA polymerase factor sigma-54 [Nitrospirota bacterium]
MALEAKLEIKLAQKLIMTPQLQQAIKLLQLSRLELLQLISQELVENPVLEEADTDATEEEPKESDESLQDRIKDDRDSSAENLVSIMDDYFEERGSDGRDLGYFSDGEEETSSYEQFLSKPTTLTDHLLWQLRLSTSDRIIEEIGEVIIGNLDENGYLQSSKDEIASISGTKPEDVEKALNLIQSFDPIGVAAKDPRECILIQLRHLGLQGSLVEEIVENHLPDIEKREYHSIAKELNISLNDVLAAVKVIEGLEPKPGRAYLNVDVRYITPDIYVQKIGEDYVINLNEDGMPKLKLSPFYRNLIRSKNLLPPSEKEYIEGKLRSALWLMKSIEQRNKTIYKVADSIVNLQKDFFEKGLDHLRPMTLKNIADEISMHESTISRTTTNKYIHTPQGLFELKFFFSGGFSSGGEKVSTVYVKNVIRKMVSFEDPKKPLSDQQIVETLKKNDISIARRTIAKYRLELNIPPTNIRKRIGLRKEAL